MTEPGRRRPRGRCSSKSIQAFQFNKAPIEPPQRVLSACTNASTSNFRKWGVSPSSEEIIASLERAASARPLTQRIPTREPMSSVTKMREALRMATARRPCDRISPAEILSDYEAL